MWFGAVPLDEAEGAILAHSCQVAVGKISKGRVLDAADLAALEAAGLAQVTVARPGPDDILEDAAAERLARALLPDGAGLACSTAATGRVNLYAEGAGIVGIDAAALHALNRVDPAITLATLAPYTRVTAGLMVATVKIIPYAVPRPALDEACARGAGALRVLPVKRRSAGLLLSAVPGQPGKLNMKARRVMADRLAALGMELADVAEVAHEPEAMAEAFGRLGGEMLLILTGSATSDLHDVGPEAVRRAGGRVDRFGMPVDPGNLLFLGALGGRPVIGLPGCARAPALNGADWVLERIACGVEVGDDDIAALGVGGLLKEIPSRPRPREGRRP